MMPHLLKSMRTGQIGRPLVVWLHQRRCVPRVLSVGAVLSWAIGVAHGQSTPVSATPTPAEQTIPAPKTQAREPDANSILLNPVEVTGTVVSPVDGVEDQLAKIRGGFNLIPSEEVEKGRVSTAADILRDQPGVFAQSAGGNDAIKISIRGSGINRGTGFFRSGILFTFDGLPVTGPSGTPFELFEPLGLQYTEVLRGANAFETGALALGGTINYVTDTGFTASPLQGRFEAGSFGYAKGQLSSGLVDGPFDYYASATGSVRQGFQDHSEVSTIRYSLNLGYKINPNVETRLYFRFGWTDFQQPGQLTRAQIRQDPSQANPGNVAFNSYRTQPGSEWIGSKTTIIIDPESTLEFGGTFQNFPIYIGGGSSAVNLLPSTWTYGNISAQLKYSRTDTFFGKQSDTQLALYTSTDIYGDVHRYAGSYEKIGGIAYRKGQLFTVNDFTGSSDNVLLVRNDTEVLPNLWFTSGIAGTYIRRNIDITFPVTRNYDKARFNYEPKLGLRYNFTPDIQVFANLSRSVEPRNDWAGVITPTTKPGLWTVLNLKEQTAWTTEIGARFKAGIFDGSISYYYSRVRDELLTVADPAFNNTTETNASPTTHQGVEIGLNTVLWQQGKTTEQVAKGGSQRIVLTQAYTWSNFYYNNDPVFGHNELPGIPEHYYQAELRYEHPSGFYAGFNVQAASSYAVDYANSFYTDSYVIFGATVGYAQAKKGLEVYLDLRNLTDEHYAADVSPGYNDHGKDVARSDPGDGFGVFGGISYKF
jgi:iron complex outermembrane receptor protein